MLDRADGRRADGEVCTEAAGLENAVVRQWRVARTCTEMFVSIRMYLRVGSFVGGLLEACDIVHRLAMADKNETHFSAVEQ